MTLPHFKDFSSQDIAQMDKPKLSFSKSSTNLVFESIQLWLQQSASTPIYAHVVRQTDQIPTAELAGPNEAC